MFFKEWFKYFSGSMHLLKCTPPEKRETLLLNAFSFASQSKYYDSETQCYYLGFRYFNPMTCRWLNRDPIEESGGLNLYAYCNGDPVNYSYDSLGRMKTLTDGNGSSTTWNYDPQRGLMTSKIYANGQGTSYTYNPDGSVAPRTWARGVATSYGYNSAGELLSVSYTDNGQPITGNVSFTRDIFGRPTSIADGTGSRTLSYNNDFTISSETIPNIANHSVSYAYDTDTVPGESVVGRKNSMSLKNGGPLLIVPREVSSNL